MDQLQLTALRSRSKPVRKDVAQDADGKVYTVTPYPRISLWTREVRPIEADIDALAVLVRTLAADPAVCLVTGAPTGPVPLDHPATRWKHARPTGPATLAETSAAWLPVDVDKFELAAPLDPLDPEAAIAEAVTALGEPFASTSHCWQLTASASPGARVLSVRLFFLVDVPIDNAQRKAWAAGLNAQHGLKLIDPAIYSAAQPIYTAAPEFVGGKDPFPRRCDVFYGELDALPWSRVPIHAPPAHGAYTGAEWHGRTSRGIAELLDAIGDHRGGLGFHEPIRDAIWRMVGQRWTEQRIKAVIRQAIGSANQSRHDRREIERYLSNGYLAESIRDAANKRKASATRPRVTQTPRGRTPLPLAQAQDKIREAIRQWLRREGPDRLVLSCTVGTGKTHLAREVIREELGERALLWAFPSHRQGDELAAEFNRGLMQPIAKHIRGRLSHDIDTEPHLCGRPDIIGAIRHAGLGRHEGSIACKRYLDADTVEVCPILWRCRYYAQFRAEDRVRLIPHALLPIHRARAFDADFMERCEGLVIDESPLSTLTGHKVWKLDDVPAGALADLLELWRTGAEVDPEAWRERVEVERKDRCAEEVPAFGPGAQDEPYMLAELARLAAKRGPKFHALYHAALSRLDGAVNSVWFGKSGAEDTVHAAWKNEIHPAIDRVLVLDATADTEVYRALLGDDVEVLEITAAQNLEVFQAIDSPVGKSGLLDPDGARLSQVCALTRSMPGAALVTHKDAIASAKERDWLPDDIHVAHFNALRGLNALEACDTLIIAGRPEPPALAMEATARALWPREALTTPGRYSWRQDGLGSVAAHDDARVDGLLRMHREAEDEQAIGRLRAVRSPHTKRVILLTHTPVSGVPVRSSTLDELLPDPKLSRLILAGDGVAPLVPALMAELCPDVWAKPKAAEDWLRKRPDFSLNRILHKGNSGLKFRREGQRCPSNALTWLPLEEARERLEDLTGKPIVWCEATPDPAMVSVSDAVIQLEEAAPMPEPDPIIRIELIDAGSRFEALIRESTFEAAKAEGIRRGMTVRRAWSKPTFSIRRTVAPPPVQTKPMEAYT